MEIWSDGTTMWVSRLGKHRQKYYAYNLSDGTRARRPKDYDDTLNPPPASRQPLTVIWSDGVTMWVAGLLLTRRLYAYKRSDKSRDSVKRLQRGLGPVQNAVGHLVGRRYGVGMGMSTTRKLWAYFSIDPGAKLSAHYVKATTATLYVGGHLDAWWYQRTSAQRRYHLPQRRRRHQDGQPEQPDRRHVVHLHGV